MSGVRLEESRAYVVIVAAGVVFALSPFLPWTKAYDNHSATLVATANDSQDTRYIPWFILAYGLVAALGATRRSVTSYVVILVTSAVMLAFTFFGVFNAENQAYPGASGTLIGTWIGFGSLGLILLAALVAILRI